MAKILVIDDDAQLLRMVGLMLERGGHTTQLMTNPLEGLSAIKASKPDLLVLDVMMPNINGHDLTRQIRATKGLEDLPILVLTARSQEVDRLTALHSGANDYLSKPVATQELIERIDKLLKNYEPQEETAVRQGMVLAFYGLRGGRGQTTLAVNLAAALRRYSQKEVCLADFSLSGNQMLTHLRMQASKSWADVAPVVGLNWELLSEHMSIHPSGLRLLSSPPLTQSSKLSADAVLRLLGLLREQMAFTIVDLPAQLNTAAKITLSEADMAFHTIAPDIVSVQTAVQLNQALEENKIKLKQRLYIINQTMAEPQIPKSAIERAVGSRVSLTIDYDANQPKALTQGVPLSLTKTASPISKFATRLAKAIWQHVST